MKNIILLYWEGDEFDHILRTKEFESKEKMIEYINLNRDELVFEAAYEIYSKIEIEPFETVLTYRLKT